MKESFTISYPSSRKVYLQGHIYNDLRVGAREIELTPTVTKNADGSASRVDNDPPPPSDTSGPSSHPAVKTDIRQALFMRMAKANTPIMMMKPMDITLEDIFLQLTTQDGEEAI